MRTTEDAQTISQNVEGKKVVIIGSSFIGMEAAVMLVRKVKSLIVVAIEKFPFERVLGEKIGESLQKVTLSMKFLKKLKILT